MHPHGAHHAETVETDAALADLLELEAEVMASYWTDLFDWLDRRAGSAGPGRIVDLGAGTGTGTIRLARQFPGAEIVAVDGSETMLDRVRRKASAAGLDARVRTELADLDATWPEVEPADLTFASMSLHHFADPDHVLGELFRATRPGGLVAVAELAEPLRFLPDDIGFGRPGLELRCLDAMRARMAHELPDLGSEWAPRLAAAGFAIREEHTLTTVLDPPHPPAVARLAQERLGRLRSVIAEELAEDDRRALDVLLDGDGPGSLSRRGDLRPRESRVVILAARPS